MKTRLVEERIGENMGPIDWSYDFRKHFYNICAPAEYQDRCCAKAVELLRLISSGGEWRVGITHSCAMHDVVDIGMYDGWPYWRPVPSFAVMTSLGIEWHSFRWLETAERR